MDKIKVVINNKQKEVKIPTGLRMIIRRCCNAVLRTEEVEGPVEVSVTLVDNDQIQELNREYRQKNMPTDVLSFSLSKDGVFEKDPETGVTMLGDVVISVPKAQEQADKFGHSFQREISHLTVHAMLHLLGYDHLDEGPQKAQMRKREDMIAAAIPRMQRP